jgi:hypothetical protein
VLVELLSGLEVVETSVAEDVSDVVLLESVAISDVAVMVMVSAPVAEDVSDVVVLGLVETSGAEVMVVSTSVDEDVSDVVVLDAVVIPGDEVVVVSTSVDVDISDVVELDAVVEELVEDEMTSIVSEVVPDEEEDKEEDEEDEAVDVVIRVDELAEDDAVLVDESVTSDTMVALVLLKLEVVETIGESELDMTVLTSELVTMVEEPVAEEIVLEVVTEIAEVTEESVTGRTILELDTLVELDLVEMIDEFEIGYKTLERLFELEIRLATILSELVETPELVGEDDLVDTGETVGVGSCVERDAVVAAEGDTDADGLINVEELPDGTNTDGLKITVAKMEPEASLRLDRSN